MTPSENIDTTPSLRADGDRTDSELEKGTDKHVEHAGSGLSALNDETLMSGESQEKVSRLVVTPEVEPLLTQ